MRTLHHTPRPELLVAELVARHAARRDAARRRPACAGRSARRGRAERVRTGARPVDHAAALGQRPAGAVRLERARAARGRRSCASRATSRRISTSPGCAGPARERRGRSPAATGAVGWYVYEAARRLVRALALATDVPARAPAAQAAGRYQRGTMISRLSLSTRRAAARRRAADRPRAVERAGHAPCCGKAGRLDEAGVDGVHHDPAWRELDRDRAGERELRVLRRRVRAGGDRAGDRDDVDDVRARPSPGRNASAVQTEPR